MSKFWALSRFAVDCTTF